jgi:hypothetical protein
MEPFLGGAAVKPPLQPLEGVGVEKNKTLA